MITLTVELADEEAALLRVLVRRESDRTERFKVPMSDHQQSQYHASQGLYTAITQGLYKTMHPVEKED